MRPRLKGALLLVLAFLLGAGAGAAGFGFYTARTGRWGPARSERFQQFVLRRLTRELELRPEQQQQVGGILRETGEQFAQLREEIRPRFREVWSRSRERIKAGLDPGQQTKFDALVAGWEQRYERRLRERRGEAKDPSKGP